jgi:hypothetical protein
MIAASLLLCPGHLRQIKIISRLTRHLSEILPRFSEVYRVYERLGYLYIQVIGPLAYDSSKPEFKGEITLSTEHTNNETFLIARWDVGAFTDHGDPHSLTYEAAIGEYNLFFQNVNNKIRYKNIDKFGTIFLF